MLEANTDRSYFTIGAVIIAGLIIAAAVWFFSDSLFGPEGMIAKSFNDLTAKASDIIGRIDADNGTSGMISMVGVHFRAALGAMF